MWLGECDKRNACFDREMKKIAISIGDVNGIGLEIALKAHNIIKKQCEPLYFVDDEVVESASKILGIKIENDFQTISIKNQCSLATQRQISHIIEPSKISKYAGEYSFVSFQSATNFVQSHNADALLTLPIHKKAWDIAGVGFVGHTDYLSHIFDDKGIMMLGCDKLFVALFTDHIPLKNVAESIILEKLVAFFLKFNASFRFQQALVLGLNPHAGDDGVLGNEDFIINEAIKITNTKLKKDIFVGAISPDIAFSPRNRERFRIIIAMYHDQGLSPLKALYFEESINITLGLPILRTSVDHGVAFDIAYQNKASITSYLNAIKFIIEN